MDYKEKFEELMRLRESGEFVTAIILGHKIIGKIDLDNHKTNSESDRHIQAVALETAYSLSLNNEFDKAKPILDYLINECLNPFAGNVLAKIYLQEGLKDNAIEQFVTNMDLFPEDVFTFNAYGMFCMKQKPQKTKEAIFGFTQALCIDSNDSFAHSNLAQMYKKQFKDNNKAKEHCEAILESEPNNFHTRLMMAQIELESDNLVKANEHLLFIEKTDILTPRQQSTCSYFQLIIANKQQDAGRIKEYAGKIIATGITETNSTAYIKTLCEYNLLPKDYYDDIQTIAHRGEDKPWIPSLNIRNNAETKLDEFQQAVNDNTRVLASTRQRPKNNRQPRQRYS